MLGQVLSVTLQVWIGVPPQAYDHLVELATTESI
jgi:hypothetical protein